MSTLHDIARRAGVSRATVARVLAGSNREVWPSAIARARRIRELAAEMGYRPNAAAKAISTGRFNAVALVMSEQPGRSYLPHRLLRQIHDALAVQRVHLTYVRLSDAQLTDADYLPDVLRHWSVDGLLLNYISHIPKGLSDLLERYQIPAIWLNHKREQDCIYPDDEEAALRLTRHLIGLGHRQIAYIGPTEAPGGAHYSVAARRDGYRRAMREAGLTPQELASPWSSAAHPEDDSHVVTESARLLRERGDTTAFHVYSDQSALPLLYAAARGGIDVPRDLSIVSYSNARHNEIAFPMTGALFPIELATKAVEMLLRRIADPAQPEPAVAQRHEFVEGRTAGPRFALSGV